MSVDDPVEQLRLGCHAYLDTARDPGVRRICIIDAPAVLDEQVRREIATANALGMVREALEASIASGRMPAQPVDALAHVLLATVMAAAQYVATADDPDRAGRDAGATIDNLLNGLTIDGVQRADDRPYRAPCCTRLVRECGLGCGRGG